MRFIESSEMQSDGTSTWEFDSTFVRDSNKDIDEIIAAKRAVHWDGIVICTMVW